MLNLKFNNVVKQVLKEQTKVLEVVAQEALKETADEIAIKMTQFIKENFYGVYSPSVYKRTETLLKSVTKTEIIKVGNSYRITIFLDPTKKGDYTNSGFERFYYNAYGEYTVPTNYNQNFDASNVFDLASQGIHGLPAKGDSGWINNSYDKIKSNTTAGKPFSEMIDEELFINNLLTKYSKMLTSSGFEVKIK